MTNEAVLLREVALPVSGTCADATGIAKGAILAMADLNTVALAAADSAIVVGVASQEKIADNGHTKIAFYDQGDFRMTASGDIAIGDAVATSSGTGNSNTVCAMLSTANLSGNVILGMAKETAATGETFRVKLQPQSILTV